MLQAHCAWCLQDTLCVLSGAGSPLFFLRHAVVWSQDSARASFVSSVFLGSPPSNPDSSCPTVCKDNVVSIGTRWPLPTCCLVNPSLASAATRPSRSDPGLPTTVCAVMGALLRLAHPPALSVPPALCRSCSPHADHSPYPRLCPGVSSLPSKTQLRKIPHSCRLILLRRRGSPPSPLLPSPVPGRRGSHLPPSDGVSSETAEIRMPASLAYVQNHPWASLPVCGPGCLPELSRSGVLAPGPTTQTKAKPFSSVVILVMTF